MQWNSIQHSNINGGIHSTRWGMIKKKILFDENQARKWFQRVQVLLNTYQGKNQPTYCRLIYWDFFFILNLLIYLVVWFCNWCLVNMYVLLCRFTNERKYLISIKAVNDEFISKNLIVLLKTIQLIIEPAQLSHLKIEKVHVYNLIGHVYSLTFDPTLTKWW